MNCVSIQLCLSMTIILTWYRLKECSENHSKFKPSYLTMAKMQFNVFKGDCNRNVVGLLSD